VPRDEFPRLLGLLRSFSLALASPGKDSEITASQVKSAEDLLSLTRLLRELWVVGPLMRAGEGEQETQQVIDDNVQGVVDMLNRLRQSAREDMVQGLGSHGSYQSKADKGPSLGATHMVSQGATQGVSQATTTQASQANGSA
jgi:hypothetical protein